MSLRLLWSRLFPRSSPAPAAPAPSDVSALNAPAAAPSAASESPFTQPPPQRRVRPSPRDDDDEDEDATRELPRSDEGELRRVFPHLEHQIADRGGDPESLFASLAAVRRWPTCTQIAVVDVGGSFYVRDRYADGMGAPFSTVHLPVPGSTPAPFVERVGLPALEMFVQRLVLEGRPIDVETVATLVRGLYVGVPFIDEATFLWDLIPGNWPRPPDVFTAEHKKTGFEPAHVHQGVLRLCYVVERLAWTGRRLKRTEPALWALRLDVATGAIDVEKRGYVELYLTKSYGGRPFVDARGVPQVAQTPALGLSEADEWRRRAKEEHASVASFHRAALELMAVGAPLALLERMSRAASEEIAHARMCLRTAAHLDGVTLEEDSFFGPLAALPPRPLDRAAIAEVTLAEAVVPEGASVTQALAQAAQTEDPVVRAAWECIARDEARHVETAEAVVRWCRTGA